MGEATSRSTAPAQEEQPTASARLEFSVRPAEIRGRAEGIVPGSEASALIKTFGVVGVSVAGITGAAVTLLAAPSGVSVWFFGLALAELVLAMMVVVLIACRDLLPGARNPRRR